MKLVIQRVLKASVTVEGQGVATIGRGALVLCGVARGDTAADAEFLARKTALLRMFADASGKMNLCAREVGGSFLVVSQFTLYGDCSGGNRPSYLDAAAPDEGEQGYEAYVRALRAQGCTVQTGRFRADMLVELQNDGPVTLLMESRGRAAV